MYYVLRPTTEADRRVLAGWEKPPTQLEWSVQQDGDDLTLSLHGCDYVRDWERQSGWKLPKDTRSALHEDFVSLFGELNDHLELTATWSGDPVDRVLDLARAELLSRVMANQIENRTTYRVSSVRPGLT